jgi:hypothetical protein
MKQMDEKPLNGTTSYDLAMNKTPSVNVDTVQEGDSSPGKL